MSESTNYDCTEYKGVTIQTCKDHLQRILFYLFCISGEYLSSQEIETLKMALDKFAFDLSLSYPRDRNRSK